MAGLYREGKIGHIGVSNFDLQECILAKQILDSEGIPLYGVQNHYSLLSREWEKKGLVDWCRKNNVDFWAWAVLEEGMLAAPKKGEKQGIMRRLFSGKRRKLYPLYKVMQEIGKPYKLTVAQVAMSYVSSEGMIPICGCRKPYQMKQLYDAAAVTLSTDEIRKLEEAADRVNVKVLGADLFRFAVRKK